MNQIVPTVNHSLANEGTISVPSHDPINVQIVDWELLQLIFFNYLPKWTENDSGSIQSQISVKWIALDLEKRYLHFGTSFKLIQSFWILRIFLIHEIMDNGRALEKREKHNYRFQIHKKLQILKIQLW